MAAVESALRQTAPCKEVIVVWDGTRDLRSADAIQSMSETFPDVAIQQVTQSPRRGASSARQLGLEAASGDFIAFLDDDDSWDPRKNEVQLLKFAQLPAHRRDSTIIAGRATYIHGQRVWTVPRTCYSQDQHLEEYLFYRRRISGDRNLIPTPTWLVPMELARSSRWTPELRKHQDWDYLLRLVKFEGAQIAHHDEVVAVVSVDSTSSTTAAALPDVSLRWAIGWEQSWSSRAYSDFVCGQVMRYAIEAKDWKSLRDGFNAMKAHERPSANALALLLGGFLGRRRFSALSSLASRRHKK